MFNLFNKSRRQVEEEAINDWIETASVLYAGNKSFDNFSAELKKLGSSTYTRTNSVQAPIEEKDKMGEEPKNVGTRKSIRQKSTCTHQSLGVEMAGKREEIQRLTKAAMTGFRRQQGSFSEMEANLRLIHLALPKLKPQELDFFHDTIGAKLFGTRGMKRVVKSTSNLYAMFVNGVVSLVVSVATPLSLFPQFRSLWYISFLLPFVLFYNVWVFQNLTIMKMLATSFVHVYYSAVYLVLSVSLVSYLSFDARAVAIAVNFVVSTFPLFADSVHPKLQKLTLTYYGLAFLSSALLYLGIWLGWFVDSSSRRAKEKGPSYYILFSSLSSTLMHTFVYLFLSVIRLRQRPKAASLSMTSSDLANSPSRPKRLIRYELPGLKSDLAFVKVPEAMGRVATAFAQAQLAFIDQLSLIDAPDDIEEGTSTAEEMGNNITKLQAQPSFLSHVKGVAGLATHALFNRDQRKTMGLGPNMKSAFSQPLSSAQSEAADLVVQEVKKSAFPSTRKEKVSNGPDVEEMDVDVPGQQGEAGQQDEVYMILPSKPPFRIDYVEHTIGALYFPKWLMATCLWISKKKLSSLILALCNLMGLLFMSVSMLPGCYFVWPISCLSLPGFLVGFFPHFNCQVVVMLMTSEPHVWVQLFNQVMACLMLIALFSKHPGIVVALICNMPFMTFSALMDALNPKLRHIVFGKTSGYGCLWAAFWIMPGVCLYHEWTPTLDLDVGFASNNRVSLLRLCYTYLIYSIVSPFRSGYHSFRYSHESCVNMQSRIVMIKLSAQNAETLKKLRMAIPGEVESDVSTMTASDSTVSVLGSTKRRFLSCFPWQRVPQKKKRARKSTTYALKGASTKVSPS